MNWVTKSLLILFVGGMCGCANKKPSDLAPGNYIRYIESEESGLKGTVQSGIWSYCFQYKPAALIALKEQDPSTLDSASILKRIKKLDRTIWFNVAISVKGKSTDPLKYEVRNLEEYNARLSYFLSQAGRNFHLQYGNKGEMEQIGYYFENNYSIKPEVVAVVGFRIPDATPVQPATLEYVDELFNAGILKFKVSNTVFQDIPRLSI